jgi:hypothetical protein
MSADAPLSPTPSGGPIMGCFGLAAVPLGMGLLFLLWLIGLAIFG